MLRYTDKLLEVNQIIHKSMSINDQEYSHESVLRWKSIFYLLLLVYKSYKCSYSQNVSLFCCCYATKKITAASILSFQQLWATAAKISSRSSFPLILSISAPDE